MCASAGDQTDGMRSLRDPSDGNLKLHDSDEQKDAISPLQPSFLELKIKQGEGEIVEAEKEISRLKKTEEALRANLDANKSIISALQPNIHVSDVSLQKGYEEILRAIERWVYDAVDTDEDTFAAIYQKRLDRPKWRAVMRNYLRGTDPGTLVNFDCSNFLVLSVITQYVLDEYVFHRPYPVGLASSQIEFLEEAEKGMQMLRPARAQSSIDRWRSETLSALTALPKFDQRKNEDVRDILATARSKLSPWLAENTFNPLEPKLRHTILEPAIKLHQSMLTSGCRYHIQTPQHPTETSPQEMREAWTLKDIDTWSPMAKEACIGTVLQCLHPALIRPGTGDETSVVLVRPTVAVTVLRGEEQDSDATSETSSADGEIVADEEQVSSAIDDEDQPIPPAPVEKINPKENIPPTEQLSLPAIESNPPSQPAVENSTNQPSPSSEEKPKSPSQKNDFPSPSSPADPTPTIASPTSPHQRASDLVVETSGGKAQVRAALWSLDRGSWAVRRFN